MEQKFSFNEIWRSMYKHKWSLLVLSILGCLAALGISIFLIVPTYQMEAQILVVSTNNKNQNAIQNDEVQANLQMINTYEAIIKSPKVLKQVSQALQGEYTTNQLKDIVQTRTDENSQVINVIAKASDPEEAAEIANITAKKVVVTTPKILKKNNLEMLNQAEGKEAHVKPVFPNKMVFGILGFLAGLFLGIIWHLFRTIFSNKIQDENEFEKLVGVPILGTVGKISEFVPSRKKDDKQ